MSAPAMTVHPYGDAPPHVRRIAEMNGVHGCRWYARVGHGPFLDEYRANFTRNSLYVLEREADALFFLRSPAHGKA